MRHTISVLVENEFGVLARVSGLFSSKGYNIDSLSVSETMDPTISRMTIVTRGSDQIIEQIIKQLNKLVNVIKVYDLTGENFITREMIMVKMRVNEKTRAEILKISELFHGKVVDAGGRSIVLEFTGEGVELSGVLNMLKPLGIVEIVRTGIAAVQRGAESLTAEGGK